MELAGLVHMAQHAPRTATLRVTGFRRLRAGLLWCCLRLAGASTALDPSDMPPAVLQKFNFPHQKQAVTDHRAGAEEVSGSRLNLPLYAGDVQAEPE